VNVDLTDAERALLLEILEEKQTRMIQEIDHTDARDFEEMLKRKLSVLEDFKRKLEQLQS
jgi:TRAP-type C4-dicarboxylate transport system substrate-binding protein